MYNQLNVGSIRDLNPLIGFLKIQVRNFVKFDFITLDFVKKNIYIKEITNKKHILRQKTEEKRETFAYF